MAQVLTISSESTEFVLVPVQVKIGGSTVDPTADPVQMAFIAPGLSPLIGDWKSASWEVTVGQFGASNTYAAKCLIGPTGGTITLSAGGYACWVKLTDNPEIPVRKAGELRVL